jgi:hypothetical protein
VIALRAIVLAALLTRLRQANAVPPVGGAGIRLVCAARVKRHLERLLAVIFSAGGDVPATIKLH